MNYECEKEKEVKGGRKAGKWAERHRCGNW